MYAFHILLSYIYSDKIPAVDPTRCLELLELANRLCMNRLVNLVEARVIDQLQQSDRWVTLNVISFFWNVRNGANLSADLHIYDRITRRV